MCPTSELVASSASQLLALFRKIDGTRRILHVVVFLTVSYPIQLFFPFFSVALLIVSSTWIFFLAFISIALMLFFSILLRSFLVHRISVLFFNFGSVFLLFHLIYFFHSLSEPFTAQRISSSTSSCMNPQHGSSLQLLFHS